LADNTPYNGATSDLKVRLGPAKLVDFATEFSIDNPFITIGSPSSVIGYSANIETEIIVEGDIDDVVTPIQTGLGYGTTGDFDQCGAWLNAAAVSSDGSQINGWYHAETLSCDNTATYNVKSIGYAVSTDGGYTYTKPNYPDNRVIYSSAPPPTSGTGGNGDHTVVSGDDGYYYLYYIDWDQNNYGYCVARSLQSDNGAPGTWTKWYNNGWNALGQGGQNDHISILYSYVYKHYSGNFLSVGFYLNMSVSPGSSAPTTFLPLNDPILFAPEGQWSRDASSDELIAYPSFVPIDGGAGPVDDTFRLYYLYLPPGQPNFGNRYLVEREVTFYYDVTAGVPQGGVEWSRYRSDTITWATTTTPAVVAPRGGQPHTFTYLDSLGYIYTSGSYTGAIPLYDCYIPSADDYIIETSADACTGGIVLLRQLGWILNYEAPNTQVVWRCHDATTNKHMVSYNEDCDNFGDAVAEFTMGYTFNY